MMKWIGRIVAWTVILGAVAALTVAVLVPRVTGATPYAVSTGSMRPILAPGSLVVARPVPVDQIGIGDVITYQLESGKPAVATHRVVAVGLNGAGERVLRTQGDANPVPDPDWVRPVQVKGAAWYTVPHLGWLSILLTTPQRQWAIHGIAALLLGYAIVLSVSAVRDRAHHRNGAQTDEE